MSHLTPSPDVFRATRVAIAALMIGTAAGALVALPLGNLALAKNSGDHGNHGGGHGNGGGNGNGNNGGNGNAGGNSAGHANDGAGGGNNGKSDDASNGNSSNGQSSDDQASNGRHANDQAPDDLGDDSSLSPDGLGKLNGFFHASPNALAHASPKSSIGQVATAFRDALSAYAAANEPPSDPNNPPAAGPSVDDLGGILAGATNKTVTAAQVRAIAQRLAELNPDDTGLGDFAANADDATCQDIADAANAAKTDGTTTATVN